MSVVRWGVDGSSVYIFLCVATEEMAPVWECCGCSLSPNWTFSVPEADHGAMVPHLEEHVRAGDCVPEWVIDAFRHPTPPQ